MIDIMFSDSKQSSVIAKVNIQTNLDSLKMFFLMF